MKGPKDGIIKVKSKYGESFKTKDKSGIYLVSVGKKYHEGAFLEASLEFMDQNFEKYQLVLADTLQRHNYLDYDKEKLNYELALQEGNLWLARNIHITSRFSNLTFSRWDDWLTHSLYPQKRKELDTLYDTHPQIRTAFRNTALSFLAKKYDITESNIQSSVEYLKEECSIIAPIWSVEKVNKVVYPGDITPAIQIVYDYYDRGNYKDYAAWLPISFKCYSILENV